jgi:hypothetical protein
LQGRADFGRMGKAAMGILDSYPAKVKFSLPAGLWAEPQRLAIQRNAKQFHHVFA